MKINKRLISLLNLVGLIISIITILSIIFLSSKYLINLNNTINDSDVLSYKAISGRIDTEFRIFYIENISFSNNPIEQDLNFLMSFTDFIEIESNFSAILSEEVEIHYSYTSSKNLSVRYRGSPTGREVQPTVFEILYPLTDINRNRTNQEIQLSSTYTIFPRQHINYYLSFISEQRFKAAYTHFNSANFFAELTIKLVYNIYIPEWDLREEVTRGYILPLSSEVYSLIPFGEDNFNITINEYVETEQQVDFLIIIIFVVTFSISFFIMIISIKNLKTKRNEFDKNISTILKKYYDEIAISSKPIKTLILPKHIIIKIDTFENLLNLSINSNENIICYKDEKKAEFFVIKGEIIYFYDVLANFE